MYIASMSDTKPPEDVVRIKFRHHDIYTNPGLTDHIKLEEIRRFCTGQNRLRCDNLKEDGTCRLDRGDSTDQARYASREWCGWACVGGARGEMTGEGFTPFPS